jgi:transcriptional regulator with PAS, ATPase and Fis domain
MDTTVLEEFDLWPGTPVLIASPAMKHVLATAQRIARTDASVLVQGESGAGKELVARAIHAYSLRASREWVDVNCGALPENLIESELFGYERGAFSGAQTSKPGMFELANKGTLFLDEIGELDLRVQVKLLRVLDGVPYYRLGGTRKVSVDVRIVAATNRDLRGMVADGQFRKDLFYRLNEVSILVPPLRERSADILALARQFLYLVDPELEISESAREKLLSYSWPGNVRELRNVITKAAFLREDSQIRAENLELEEEDEETELPDYAPVELNDLEKRAVLRMLKRTNGHQQQAASALGISRRTLSRRLREYGISARRSA